MYKGGRLVAETKRGEHGGQHTQKVKKRQRQREMAARRRGADMGGRKEVWIEGEETGVDRGGRGRIPGEGGEGREDVRLEKGKEGRVSLTDLKATQRKEGEEGRAEKQEGGRRGRNTKT